MLVVVCLDEVFFAEGLLLAEGLVVCEAILLKGFDSDEPLYEVLFGFGFGFGFGLSFSLLGLSLSVWLKSADRFQDPRLSITPASSWVCRVLWLLTGMSLPVSRGVYSLFSVLLFSSLLSVVLHYFLWFHPA